MKRVAVILGVCVVLIGCGSSDPNQAVADHFVKLGELDDVCPKMQVYGRERAKRWLLRDMNFGSQQWAQEHVFTDGATPDEVASTLLARCLPDGTWR